MVISGNSVLVQLLLWYEGGLGVWWFMGHTVFFPSIIKICCFVQSVKVFWIICKICCDHGGETVYMSSLMHLVSLALVFLQGQRMPRKQVPSCSASWRTLPVQAIVQKYWMTASNVKLLKELKGCPALSPGCAFLGRGFANHLSVHCIQVYRLCRQSNSGKASFMNPTKVLGATAKFSTLKTTVSTCIPARRNTNVQRILPMGLGVLG